MIEQIKKALENANTPYRICEEMGDVLDKNDNTVADFIYHDEDAHLIANAPEWLRYLIGEVERLNSQINAEVSRHVEKEMDLEKRVKQEEKLYFNSVRENRDIQRKLVEANSRIEELQKALEEIATKPIALKVDVLQEIARKALKGAEPNDHIQPNSIIHHG